MILKNIKLNKGFTLIELLVVISIIGVLSSIVLSNLHAGLIKAKDAKRRQDAYEIVNAVNLYYSDIGSYPPVVDDDAYGGWDSSEDGIFIQNLIDGRYISSMPQDPSWNGSGTRSYFYGNDIGASAAGCPVGTKAVIKHYPEGPVNTSKTTCFGVGECTCLN